MNTKQEKINEWLAGQDERLSELYRGALQLKTEKAFPAKHQLIAHCLREIINRLPEAISGQKITSRVDYPKHLNGLINDWEQQYNPIRVDNENNGTTITPELAKKIDKLVKDHEDGARKNIEKGEILFQLDPENAKEKECVDPLRKRWTEIGRLFVGICHGDGTSDPEINDKIKTFEDILLSFIDFYYEGHNKISSLIEKYKNGVPQSGEVDEVLNLIGNAHYRRLFFENFDNPEWIDPLRKKGFFQKIPGQTRWTEGYYLEKISASKPKQVLQIINKIKTDNSFVISKCIECLLEMSSMDAQKGLLFLKANLKERRKYVFYWEGKAAAKLMAEKLFESDEDAFVVAGLLLDVWRLKESENKGSFQEICAKFRPHDYKTFIAQYYSKLWERYPYLALLLLVQIYEGYLCEVNRGKNYDTSELFYHYIENIEKGSSWKSDRIDILLIEAMRDCINVLIGAQPEKITDAQKLLQSKNKAIFTRLEMYLLKKSPGELFWERINEITRTREYFDSRCYSYEYNLLFGEKKEIIKSEVKQAVFGWIEDIKIDDMQNYEDWFEKTHDRKPGQEDIIICESRYKAARLYPIREVFPVEYEKYKKLAKSTDEDLKPKSIRSEARGIAGDEGSPLTTEKMLQMAVKDVFEYLSKPENYNYKPKEFQFNTPQEALEYAFQKAVKAKPVEYLKIDSVMIQKMSGAFWSAYFYGLLEALREKKIEGFDWDQYLKIAEVVVEIYSANPEIAVQLRSLVECIKEGFDEKNKIEYTEERLDTVYQIIRILIEIPEDKSDEQETDPIQIQCNSTAGEALRTTISLGLSCKIYFEEKYKSKFKKKIVDVFDVVLNKVKKPWMICTFGSDFSRVYSLAPEWVDKNIEIIFSNENWQAVWGTYLHWSDLYRSTFKYLQKMGIYDRAVQKKDELKPANRGEKPDEKLANHIVIAYFNGWFEKEYEEPLLQKFIKDASDELLGYMASFFTTGFKAVAEEKNKKEEKVNRDKATIERIAMYWQRRLDVIEKNPEAHVHEASGLACWILECPIEKKAALELEKRTLEICRGKFVQNDDYDECINALCSYADVDVLTVIRCVRIMIHAPDMVMEFDFYENELTKLLENIRNDQSIQNDLKIETMYLVDELGKMQIYKYHPIYEALSKKTT
jgi:hypothetical protein